MRESEIIVDNFAGGGGASTGIEMAIGRRVDIAINHDPNTIANLCMRFALRLRLPAAVSDWPGSPRIAATFPKRKGLNQLKKRFVGLLGLFCVGRWMLARG